MLVLLGLALATSPASAQQDLQVPSWQQRPAVQQTSYVSPSPYGAQTTSWRTNAAAPLSQRQAYRTTRQPRAMPVSQSIMAEPAAAEGGTQAAPEEVYPQATPDAAVSGAEMPPAADDGAYYEGYDGCGEACGDVGPCWGPGEFYGWGGCCPWLGLMDPGRLWFRGEALVWWTKGMDIPALVETGPSVDDLAVVFGNQFINDGARGGWRMSFGLRPTECTPWGIEASYFRLDPETTNFDASSDGRTTLARPFYDILGATNDFSQHIIANTSDDVPAEIQSGWIHIGARTRLDGVEVLFRRQVYDWCAGQLDLIGGWRHNRLRDDLDIHEFSEIDQSQIIDVGTTIERFDRFQTSNIFNGGEVGVSAHWQYSRWSLEMLMKVALGSTRSRVLVAGSSTTTPPLPAPAETADFGVLALPSNIGIVEKNTFTMMPELGVAVGYDITCHLRATFSYSLMYWGRVARAGDQINLDLNVPVEVNNEFVQQGLARPKQPFVTNDFWAQGMTLGLEYSF